MRENLQKYFGKRLRFTATVGKFGRKSAFKGPAKVTVCFKNVKFMDGKPATDHVWINVGKIIHDMMLLEGDVVEFDGKITEYSKGFKGRGADYDAITFDYRLSNVNNIKKLSII